jgi:hypothetical protein
MCNIYSQEASKPIVDTIKQIIKDKKTDSQSKVMAIKLLNLCLMEGGGTEKFALYMEQKIMSRL